LETSAARVNSAPQRAQTTLAEHQASGRLATTWGSHDAHTERSPLNRYVAAWRACDVPGLVAEPLVQLEMSSAAVTTPAPRTRAARNVPMIPRRDADNTRCRARTCEPLGE